MQNKETSPYLLYILFALLAICNLAIFSAATSPLYDAYLESDSDVFILMGKLLNIGYVPYIDFFDHKGPVIMFINAFAVKLLPDARTSVFVLQVINLTLTQIITYHTARLILNKKNSVIVVLSALILVGLTIPRGNYTEEWSLPYLALATLFGLKFYLSKTTSFSKWKALVLGASFAFIFWMRANNTAIICAVVIYIFISQVSAKDWKSVLNLISFFTLGFLLICLPIVGYIIYLGAFDEMVYACFIFNFKYSNYEMITTDRPLLIAFIETSIKLYPFIILIIGSIAYYLKTKNRKIILPVTLLIFWAAISTQLGPAYTQYMLMTVPLVTIGAILSLHSIEILNKNHIVTTLLMLIALAGCAAFQIRLDYSTENRAWISALNEAFDEAYALIPENERDQIYTYEMPSHIYTRTGFIPNKNLSRYIIFQDWHGKHDSKIYGEINDMMLKKRPKWIFARVYNPTNIKNDQFYDILEESYVPVLIYKPFTLYKAKEQ